MSGSMCDATCSKCGKRIGWAGEPRDMPPCPRCGHRPDPVALSRDQAELEFARRVLTAEGPETEDGRTEAVWLQDWLPGTYLYVARRHPNFPDETGLFGNPFAADPKARAAVIVPTVAAAVEHYRRWLAGDPDVAALLPTRFAVIRRRILAALPALRGKRLACFRHEGPCHARVLCELADGPLGEPPAQEDT